MAIRGWLAGAVVVLAAVTGAVAYRQVTADNGCPAGLAPVRVQTDGSPGHWSACANRSGSVMVLTNDGPAVLLVAPQVATTLGPEASTAGREAPDDVASLDLATTGHPAADLQAAGLSSSWRYLGPHESARATTGGVAAAVTVIDDYYATARWTLARSVAGWAAGQNPAVETRDVVSVSRGCAARLSLPVTYRQHPPDLTDVVRAVVRDRRCVSMLRTLAPVDDDATVSYDVADMAAQFARTVPADGWSDISEEAIRILRAQ